MIVVAESAKSVWLGCQRPSLLHLPNGTPVAADDALYLLGEWGFGYDDWQTFTMVESLREQADGRWAAKEVGLEVPRQNGKGELYEGRECLGLFFFGERKLIHSAHEFATASEALDRMDDRIAQNPQLKRLVRTVKRSHGEEGVYLRDGRKLLYKTRTKGSGRGFSADFLGLDEAMHLAETFLGALMPVISARPNPQIWYAGSPPDQQSMDHGVVFARLRERALAGQAGRMAYFGWSPAYQRGWRSPDDVPREATEDPQVISEANPALGIRIDLEHIVQTEREAMDHRTFCVERLGVGDWPTTDGSSKQVIDPAQWSSAADASSGIVGPVVLTFDVTPNRTAASIGAAGVRSDDLHHTELADHGPGTGWVIDRLLEMRDTHPVAAVCCDGNGPAASLLKEAEQKGLEVRVLDAKEYSQACGMFVDAIDQATVRHPDELLLNTAVRGAAQRPLGDAWAWSRKNSNVDISPLVACTLAHWGVVSGIASQYDLVVEVF